MDITELFGMASSDLEAMPKYKKRVRERIAAGLCLAIDVDESTGVKTECNCVAVKRGVCLHHHHRFRMDRLDTAKNRRKTFEDGLILRGELMPSRQGQRIRRQQKAG